MKRPPYALRLDPIRKYKGLWIFAGAGAWRRASRMQGCALVLPAKALPDDYDWSCARGREVVLVWHGANEDQVIRFGCMLVKAGAELVVGLGDRLHESIFVRGRRRGYRG